MKKMLALLLTAALCLSLVSFAAAEDMPEVANTYYSYGFDVHDMFMNYYIHFYGEVPGLGKVFHAGMCMDQITFNGTYEIIPEEHAYSVYMDYESSQDGNLTEGTAPFTVVFYDFEGKEIDRCAIDSQYVYNDMKAITGIGGENCVLALDTDPENGRFAAQYGGEPAVALMDFVNPEDDTATLALKINGKYDDLVVMYVEGTYSMNEDQSVITLIPKDESDDGATVTLNEDGTYTYVSDSGDEVPLVKVEPVKVIYVLKGDIPVPGMEDTIADLVCNLYNDGTVRLIAEFAGVQLDVDQGTYEIDMSTYSFIIHFEGAGDLTTERPDGGDIVLNYKKNDDRFGEMDRILTFVAE